MWDSSIHYFVIETAERRVLMLHRIHLGTWCEISRERGVFEVDHYEQRLAPNCGGRTGLLYANLMWFAEQVCSCTIVVPYIYNA